MEKGKNVDNDQLVLEQKAYEIKDTNPKDYNLYKDILFMIYCSYIFYKSEKK